MRLLAYQTAFMKAHYPVEFIAALADGRKPETLIRR